VVDVDNEVDLQVKLKFLGDEVLLCEGVRDKLFPCFEKFLAVACVEGVDHLLDKLIMLLVLLIALLVELVLKEGEQSRITLRAVAAFE